jgi:nucleoside-diphosphate-sugar epimerase
MIAPARTVAVTGAGGFLGRYVCRALHERGYRVRAISSQPLASREQVDVVTLSDLCDVATLERVLKGAEAVIHLAGAAHVFGPAGADWSIFERANVTSVEAVFAAAARTGATHAVLVSSAAVVGDPGGEIVSATTPPRPTSAYGRSKLEGELGARRTLSGTSVRLRVFRPPMIYGPGMRGNPLRLFSLVDRGVWLPLGGIRNRRSVLSVRNLSDAIVAGIESNVPTDAPLYISDDHPPSTPSLIRAIAAALRRPARLLPVPQGFFDGLARSLEVAVLLPNGIRRKADDLRRLTGSFVVDSTVARATLGFVPTQSLDEGLHEAAEWWRMGRQEIWP